MALAYRRVLCHYNLFWISVTENLSAGLYLVLNSTMSQLLHGKNAAIQKEASESWTNNMCRTFLVVLVLHKMCLYTFLWGATILRRAFACFWVGTSISEIISVLLALDTFIYGYSEDCHAKDQYCIICKIEKSSNSFSACLLSNKDVRCYVYILLYCSIIMKL